MVTLAYELYPLPARELKLNTNLGAEYGVVSGQTYGKIPKGLLT